MLILALDSTAIVASVALCRDHVPIASFTVKNGNTHSETLLPMVESVLKTAGFTVDDIDLFACSVGPGSFTGVRIGASTVKGLAFGKNKPCVAVSTLEALAENLVPFGGILCPVMNARRQQVYTALFRAQNGTLERLMPDSAIPITELDERLGNYHEPVRLCGDGYEITEALLTHPILPVPSPLRQQSAYSVAQVARIAFENGAKGFDVDLAPTYLRLSQAERERAERLGIDTGI